MYITPNDKKTFQAILLLDLVSKQKLKTISNSEDTLLEPLVIELMGQGYVAANGIYYELTAKGEDSLTMFMKRYNEYLKIYDVFAFVDLDKAEFAFSSYYNFDTDEAWHSFKIDTRFEDLRIAVALFKFLNPAEIVFMSFINEGRFETSATGWQMDILSDAIWSEIEDICETALKPEQLGEDAMKDIIEQGSKIVVSLIKEEERRNAEERHYAAEHGFQNEEVVEEVVEESTYYESYYDPYYVSPFWLLPILMF